MSRKIKTEAVDNLFEGILSLKNKEECYIFFEDICTINELLSLSQISRVNRSLNYGNDGYDMVFDRIENKE